MEGGAGFHGFQGLQRSSLYGTLAPEARGVQPNHNCAVVVNGSTAARNNVGGNGGGGGGGSGSGSGGPACAVREQDRFMPIANVIRIMRKVLPTHAKISDDAKETIQECVSEYISFITSEANERCQREQRKTITAEDVLWAMSKLGFDDYVEPLSVYLQRYRELEGDHRGSIRGEPLPMKRAAAPPHSDPAAAFYGAQPLPLLPQPSFQVPPPAIPHHHLGAYGEGMGGYYVGMYGGGGGGGGGIGDGSGAGSSHAPMAGFDHPYAPYK